MCLIVCCDCLNFEIINSISGFTFRSSFCPGLFAFSPIIMLIFSSGIFFCSFGRANEKKLVWNDVRKFTRTFERIFGYRFLSDVVVIFCIYVKKIADKNVNYLEHGHKNAHGNEHNLHLWQGTCSFFTLFSGCLCRCNRIDLLFLSIARNRNAIFSEEVKPIKIQMQI